MCALTSMQARIDNLQAMCDDCEDGLCEGCPTREIMAECEDVLDTMLSESEVM